MQGIKANDKDVNKQTDPYASFVVKTYMWSFFSDSCFQ